MHAEALDRQLLIDLFGTDSYFDELSEKLEQRKKSRDKKEDSNDESRK